jgi:type I restriction enzyme S subunit
MKIYDNTRIEKDKIPMEWKVKKLDEIAEIIMGQSPPSRTYNTIGKGLPFFQGKAEFGKLHPTVKKWCIEPKKIARKKDILMSVRAPVGPVNLSNMECCIGRGLCAIRAIPSKLNFFYLYYYLKLNEDVLSKKGQGSTFAAISRKDVHEIKIPIPFPNDPKRSLEIQQKIVSRLDAFFEHYNELKKEKQKAKEKYEQIIQSAIASFIAKGEWQKSELGEICVINPPKKEVKDFSDDLEVSFVPMSFVDDREGAIKKQEIKKLAEVRRGYTYFKENDVLFAKITPCMENGKAAIAKNLKNGLGFGSTEFHVIRPNENILPEFIFYYIRQPFFRGEAASKMSGTAGQLRVPKRFLEDYEIPLPPIEEQKKIVKLLEKIKLNSSSIYEQQKNIDHQLEQLPKAVLSKAFRGELVN